ncbi:alpha/beta hydrolase [Geomonas sp. RF6]|uniref:alpha/beta fold hydrolase n=1 Tax=Geomonas sp. RF6 TaxID=2897342 RepID=UPI001E2FF006|nr:alpha/beta hydrolase [Geomonas sp. RF6]UFS68929.1 alpha/beta hydrolase [Geomonas sp. RF6]
MKREFPEPAFIRSNGISMAVYEEGAGFPVILCHGFPELAFSWRHQLPALAQAGFRAIAPDQRGYGLTEKPDAVCEYNIGKLTDDLVGLLDALELEKAVFCGHDWGGHVVWEMPLLHPDRVAGVIGVNTPHRYFRRMGSDPVAWIVQHFSDRNYRLAFLQEGVEDGLTPELLPRFFDGLFRGRPITMEQYLAAPPKVRNLEFEFIMEAALAEEPAGRQLLTQEELQVYVDAFSSGGLTGPINWYRNLVTNSEILAGTPEHIAVPCLMLSSGDDIFLPPSSADGTERYIADLEMHVIRECGHWTQAEKPSELNAIILDWLKRRFA